MIQYDIFRVYRYFCNLIISMITINTLLCNPIFDIRKSLSHRFRGYRYTVEPHKIYVFSSFFFISIL